MPSAALRLWLYGVGACALAAVLLVASENLRFQDVGDFGRTAGFMLELPEFAKGLRWPFRPQPLPLGERFDLGHYVFGAMGWLQSLYSDHFDLRFSAILAKLALAFCADLLARQIAPLFARPLLARALAFTALLLAMSAAHNAGMLKSLYGEYLFFLTLPPLLYGLLRSERPGGQWTLLAAALLGGLSKAQYFYIPVLAIACLLLQARRQRPTPAWLLAGLAAAQLACVLPALHNPFAQLNRHQSTYWGSYLVLSEAELRGLGLDDRQLACVGIDGWGHKALGPGGSEPLDVGADKTCYGHQTLGLGDVLAPYLRYPTTLPRLLAFAMPAHFHVHYFHVYKTLPYLVPSQGSSYRSGRWLVQLSALRDRVVTPLAPALLLTGVLQAGWRRTCRHAGLSACALFLALFSASQVLVSLLGEGVRDLGKHMWGAQLALDFLVLTLAAQCAVLWAERAAGRPAAPPA